MKTIFIILIGIILFCFGAVAQAEDPYSGTYTCSGTPQEGCGTCTDFEMGPPRAVIITKVGDTYKFCAEYGDSNGLRDDGCTTGTIQDGVAHWNKQISEDQLTIDAKGTATFNNSSLTLEESGTISGECNCNFSLKAICTK